MEENFLFDIDKINKDLQETSERTEEINKQIPMHGVSMELIIELRREKESLERKKGLLNTFLLFHKLVDLGEEAPALKGNSLMAEPAVKHFWGNIQDYLNINKLAELSLLPTHAMYRDEPALLFVYRANKGAVACINGMRYVTYDVFAAKDDYKEDCSSYGAAKDLLEKYIVSPFIVGLHDFVLRSIPIRIPPKMDWKEIQQAIDNFLRRNVIIRDGWLEKEDESFHKIFGLVKPEWWKSETR